MPQKKSKSRNKGKKPGELKVFAAASCLNDIGSDAVRPFWPMLVVGILGAPMWVLGFLDGLGDAISSTIRLPAGYFSDKLRKRKPFIWIGYLMAALGRIGYALSTNFQSLFAFKAMDRAGKLRDPPRDALLSELTKRRARGKAFGLLTAADNFGAMLGPLLGMLLVLVLPLREIFFVAALPSIISALLILIFIKERKKSKKKFTFDIRGLNRNLKMLIAISSLFALTWFSISFMIVFVGKALPVWMLPLLFVLMSAAASAISVPAGKLSDKIGRKPVLAIGWLLFGAMCAGFLLFPVEYAIPASFALFGIYGLHYGIVTTIQSPLVADLSPKRIRGSAIGLYQTVIGLCALPAGVIAGMLWEVNPVIPFLTGLCISITSAILLFLFVREKGFKKHEAK